MAVEVTSLVLQLVEAYKICHLVGLKKQAGNDPYLRLKNRKGTSKCQVFSSTVPAWGKIFQFFLKSPVSRIVPKNLKRGPLGVFGGTKKIEGGTLRGH